MSSHLKSIYDKLFIYCQSCDFMGFDPFDGLESELFRSSSFSRFAFARLAWLQIVKRSPFDLRGLLSISKGTNSKGIALFALAEASRYRESKDEAHRNNAAALIERLRSLAIPGIAADGQSWTAFGYNFDWQSRAFYAPKGTPTIVPTAFAANAFLENYRAFGDRADLETAELISNFIVSALQRPHQNRDEICFSYTPDDSSVIYNASLLAGEVLAGVGVLASRNDLIDLAAGSARFVIRRQNENGSWHYGPKLRHSWVDNFHTAFILSSLHRISSHVSAVKDEASTAIAKGSEFWLNELFLEDGTPKYFDSKTFPVDIHSAAAAIATLSELSAFDDRALPLAEKVAEWTITHLRDPSGYFYYQQRRFSKVKIPFIRWGQAWMSFALARLIEAKSTV